MNNFEDSVAFYRVLNMDIWGISGRDLTFIHPHFGPDTYANVGSQIEQADLIRPTMSQITSLVHTSYNSNDRYSKEIAELMKGLVENLF